MATDSPSSTQSSTSDNPPAERQYNVRLGLVLFFVYLVLYLGFVLINAFAASLMETITIAGLNLAIVYGFGLIVVALILALVYGFMCRTEVDAEAVAKADEDQGGSDR